MEIQTTSWNEALQHKSFVGAFLFWLSLTLIVVSFLPFYFNSIIGPKPGVQLNDFVLNLISPQDHSWIIFGCIYVSLLTILYGLRSKPFLILLGLKGYVLITLLRMITMYVFTLEPPAGIIPLHDPIVDVIAYGGQVFTKDLFFSGHIATLTLFVLLEERQVIRKLLIVNTVIVSGLILLQRVHYTIDVLAAPFITYASMKLVKYISK